MYAEVSHPYTVQVAALWLSFIPGFAVAALIAISQFERRRRRRTISDMTMYSARRPSLKRWGDLHEPVQYEDAA